MSAIPAPRSALRRGEEPDTAKVGYIGFTEHAIRVVRLVQHEFGIFGGLDGDLLLDFTRNLTAPYVVTLHTVLPTFSCGEAAVVKALCREAAAI